MPNHDPTWICLNGKERIVTLTLSCQTEAPTYKPPACDSDGLDYSAEVLVSKSRCSLAPATRIGIRARLYCSISEFGARSRSSTKPASARTRLTSGVTGTSPSSSSSKNFSSERHRGPCLPANHLAPAVDHDPVLIGRIDDFVDVEMFADFNDEAGLFTKFTCCGFGNALERMNLPARNYPTAALRIFYSAFRVEFGWPRCERAVRSQLEENCRASSGIAILASGMPTWLHVGDSMNGASFHSALLSSSEDLR